MKQRRSPSFAALVLSALFATSIAHADVIGPDEQACQGRAESAACITPSGGAGICTTRTLPVGNPANDASRQALICVSDSDASTNADSGVGAESPAAQPGCRCSTVAHTRSRTTALAVMASCALGFAAIARRAKARRSPQR